MTRHLVIFVKEPQPGRVKTRLGRDIGMTSAAWWFRHQTAALIRAVGRDSRWQTSLAVSPDRQGLESRVWPYDLSRRMQGPGDLGHRMARIFRQMPPGPVMIIGADIPGIGPRHIAEAFSLLGRHDAVFGPAPDGGYWLIGLKRGALAVPSGFCQHVRWSSADALRDTSATLPGHRIGHAATLRDVDVVADLAALKDPPAP